VKETVVTYTSKSEIDKVLIEATANENWNIANSKLQILADASYSLYDFDLYRVYFSENSTRIMEHLKQKLDVPAFEWRRVLKV
jgi:hypothetical protein